MPDISAGGVTGFQIAEGFVEVETRWDDDKLQRTAKRSFSRLSSLAGGVLGKLSSTVTGIVGNVVESASKLAGQAATSILSMGTSIVTAGTAAVGTTAATGGLNVVLGALLAIVGGLVLAVPILVGGFLALAPILLATGGAAGAMTTAMVGMIATSTVLKWGLAGISDGLKELSDKGEISEKTLKKLSPEAVKVVKALWGFREPLDHLKKFVQDRVLDGMAARIKDLGEKWLPALEPILGGLADDVNHLGKELFNALGKPEFINNIQVAASHFGDMIRDIGHRALPGLIEAFGNLAAKSGPVLKAIGDIIVRIVKGFSDWINSANKSGALKTFMEDAAETITRLWNIGTLAFKIMGNLVKILFPPSKDASGGVLGTIEGFLTRINDWLSKPENQKKIRDWVNNAIQKFKEFVAWVRDVAIPKAQEWITKIEGWITKIQGWIDKFNAFKDRVGQIWNGIKTFWQTGLAIVIGVVGALTGQTRLVATAHNILRDRISTAWTNIKNAARSAYSWLVTNVFGPLVSRIRSTVPAAFTAGVNAIGNAWERLRSKAAAPISFIVNTVIQKGLIDNFNRVSKVVGGPTLPRVSFSAGGTGSGLGRAVAGAIGDGEGLKPGEGDGLGDAMAGPAKWLGAKMGLGRVKSLFGNNKMTQLLTGAGGKLLNAGVTKLKSLFAAFDFGGGGGSVGAGGLRSGILGVLAFARSLIPGLNLISGLRPGARTLSGSLSYHGFGRAIDLPAIRLLGVMIKNVFGSRLKELITPWRDLNMLNGRPHRYSYAIEAQHGVFGRNRHIHAAMDDEGVRVLQPGYNVIPNWTGRPEPIAGRAGMRELAGDTFVFDDGAIRLDMSKINDVQDFLDMVKTLKPRARQFAVSGVSAR